MDERKNRNVALALHAHHPHHGGGVTTGEMQGESAIAATEAFLKKETAISCCFGSSKISLLKPASRNKTNTRLVTEPDAIRPDHKIHRFAPVSGAAATAWPCIGHSRPLSASIRPTPSTASDRISSKKYPSMSRSFITYIHSYHSLLRSSARPPPNSSPLPRCSLRVTCSYTSSYKRLGNLDCIWNVVQINPNTVEPM